VTRPAGTQPAEVTEVAISPRRPTPEITLKIARSLYRRDHPIQRELMLPPESAGREGNMALPRGSVASVNGGDGAS